MPIIIKAYNNGTYDKTGSGYGFRLKNADVKNNSGIFPHTIFITFDTELGKIPVNINQNSVVYGNSVIFTKKEIGIWLIRNGMGTWKEGNPPEFLMEHDVGNHFTIQKLVCD